MIFSVPDGAWPILLTPFTAENTIDFGGLSSLIAFYQQVGVPGMLALGQASEVLELTDDERFAIAKHVGEHCQGRLPVAAVGNYGETLEEQAAALERIATLGIDVSVVALALLPSGDQLGEQLLKLIDMVNPSVHLGIYELPEPEHRLLSPEEVSSVARTGRYYFMKDTCRQIEPFTAKLQAASGTPLKFFQANLRVLPPSMEVGSSGFCGWMPMVAPELCAQVVDMKSASPEVRQQAYEKLMEFQTMMVETGFPASAKYVLSQRGVCIHPYSRVNAAAKFNDANARRLLHYLTSEDRYAPIRA